MIDWERLYNRLIVDRSVQEKQEGIYTELHHIVPRYQGGTNEKVNLVRLSIKNHVLAHYILWRWKGNLQDKIAYKMKGGQTEEGNVLRIKLAHEALKNSGNYAFRYNNPMSNPEKMVLALQTKRKKYNGLYHSEEGSKRILLLCNSGKQHSPESTLKRVNTCKNTRKNMTDSEYYEKYVDNHKKEKGSQYGKKRPGELAGNYGTSKGTYILVSPQGDRLNFRNLTSLMRYGLTEGLIKNWRNKGPILPQPNNKRSKWIGYQIEYKVNTGYGRVNKKVQSTKRSIDL